MIDGVQVLETGTICTIPFWIAAIGLCSVGIWGIVLSIKEMTWCREFFDWFVLGMCVFVTLLGTLAGMSAIALHNEPLYTVVLDEEVVDYQEFHDEYEIWGHEGNIYEIYKKGE